MFKELFEAKAESTESNGYRISYRFGSGDHNAIIGEIGTEANLGATPVNPHYSIDDILSFFEKATGGKAKASGFKKDAPFMRWLKSRAKISGAKNA